MRKNRLFILGIFTVMVALVSLSLVSGTWAKYTSTVSGSDTAKVAKWAWTYNGTALTESPSALTFDLLQTRKDSNGTDEETDVKTGLIAPGTSGSFTLAFVNNSEVTANYAVSFVVDENGVPLEWSTDGSTWSTDLANIAATQLAMEGGNKTETIHWRWAFEQADVDAGDAVDKGLGFTAPEISVTVNVTFTQVD